LHDGQEDRDLELAERRLRRHRVYDVSM
jgi:hypothetical protein